jgi:hypothetical protein
MSSTGLKDGAEDVNDFLVRIRELGDKRDREDEERTRKLEEEILQARRERQARRAGELLILAVVRLSHCTLVSVFHRLHYCLILVICLSSC